MSNNFLFDTGVKKKKQKFSNICELKTHDTRKTILLIKFEEYSCVRKRVINFYIFYTFALQMV